MVGDRDDGKQMSWEPMSLAGLTVIRDLTLRGILDLSLRNLWLRLKWGQRRECRHEQTRAQTTYSDSVASGQAIQCSSTKSRSQRQASIQLLVKGFEEQ